MVIKRTKAWQRQHELKKQDVPSIEEVDNIISSIRIGKVNIDFQTKRAKALFAMYYLTACRNSEIIRTKKLRKQRMKANVIYEGGMKKKIYELDPNSKPIIEKWTEEHEFLGTRKKDIRYKEFGGYECLEIRTENRKNKDRISKLLPVPIEKEKIILKYVLQYINNISDDAILFNFNTSRARQIIKETTKYNLHFIRHIRATHLITLYDFNEQMLVRFMGWTDARPAKAYIELSSSDLAREFFKGDKIGNS